jgi:hypothetical protein
MVALLLSPFSFSPVVASDMEETLPWLAIRSIRAPIQMASVRAQGLKKDTVAKRENLLIFEYVTAAVEPDD